MTDVEQKIAAKQFIKDWSNRGDEKQETQLFWISLPLLIGIIKRRRERAWRPAKTNAPSFGGSNTLCLPLPDVGPFVFSDEGKNLQHNVAQESAH